MVGPAGVTGRLMSRMRDTAGGACAARLSVCAAAFFTRARVVRLALVAALLALSVGLAVIALPAAHSEYVPRNHALQNASLFFYPPHAGTGPAPAFVFFFGNDVGFWSAHQELADDSLGAEIAVWSAGHVPIPDLIGVVAISPGARGHLRASWRDITNAGEPDEPGSFSVAREVAALPPAMRVALVRGAHDSFRYADSAIVAAGGQRIQLAIVPLAGHSLKRVTLARYIVRNAVGWVIEGQPPR